MITPAYMDNMNPLVSGEGVEVVGAPQLVKDQDGKAKETAAFAGLVGFKIPVEVVRGVREKRLPDGDTVDLLETKRINVTVWGKSQPFVSEGDYVVFHDLMVGAVDSSLFYQALGVSGASGE